MGRTELSGLLYLVLSGVFFVAMSAAIKSTVASLPASEILFFRSAVSTIIYTCIFPSCRRSIVRTLWSVRVFARSLLGFLNFFVYALCLSRLSLSEVSAIFYTTPVWSFCLGWIVLRERPTPLLCFSLVSGFAGMLCVLKPSIVSVSPWLAAAFLGAGLGSLAVLSVRQLVVREAPERIAMAFMAWSAMLALPPAACQWIWPTIEQVQMLCLIGAFAALAQLFMTKGYASTRLVTGGQLDFVRLPASVAFGMVLFDETHDMWTVFGLVLVFLGFALSVFSARNCPR
jgi:drug/metabolite transporter (DMT)-like permease